MVTKPNSHGPNSQVHTNAFCDEVEYKLTNRPNKNQVKDNRTKDIAGLVFRVRLETFEIRIVNLEIEHKLPERKPINNRFYNAEYFMVADSKIFNNRRYYCCRF